MSCQSLISTRWMLVGVSLPMFIPSNISEHACLSAMSGGLHKDRGGAVQSLIKRFRHAPPRSRRERQLESAEGSAGHDLEGAHAVCSCPSNLQAPVLSFKWRVCAAETQLAQHRSPWPNKENPGL